MAVSRLPTDEALPAIDPVDFSEVPDEVDFGTPAAPRSARNTKAPGRGAAVTRHEIRDARGDLVAIHQRRPQADGDKVMTWHRPDGTPGLNGTAVADLPLFGAHLVALWPPTEPIIVTEGEKAAAALQAAELPALGTVTGAASTPSIDALEPLRARDVVLWPDNDAPGQAHMQRVAERLLSIGCSVRILEWPAAPEGGDAADLLEAGSVDDVGDLVAKARRVMTPEQQLRELLPQLSGEFRAQLERAYALVDAEASTDEPVDRDATWPDSPTAPAFHGLAGELVAAVEEHTEADPVAVLGSVLAVFGAVAGSGRSLYQGSPQTPNEYVALVGDTSAGRKGTSLSIVRAMFDAAYPAWTAILVPGLGSGEGLIAHLKRNEGTEQRALVLETELGRLLGVMTRDGSTLSPTLRDAWDGVPIGRFLAREGSVVARHHVGLLAHITRAELRERLTDVDAANGFGNRFLWLAVRRARLVPFPRSPRELIGPLVGSLRRAIDHALEAGELRFTAAAADRWEALYTERAERRRYGLTGALTARAEAHIARLALLYALLDQADDIDVVHLAAGEAVWDYAERSARHIFGDSTGDPLADYIRGFLRDGPATREELRQETGQRDATRLGRAIDRLVELGLARVTKAAPSGRAGRRPDVVSLVALPALPAIPTGSPAYERAGESARLHRGNAGNSNGATVRARVQAPPEEM